MPRIRSIKHDLYLDEDLAQLPLLCRYAFPGLWTLADREGRLEDRPARIKAQLFPYEPDIDMDTVLMQLAAGGFVVRYEVAGVRYLQIRSFGKHQQVNARESQSRIPAPPGHVPAAVPPPPDEPLVDSDTCAQCGARACTCTHVGNGNGIQGKGTDLPPEGSLTGTSSVGAVVQHLVSTLTAADLADASTLHAAAERALVAVGCVVQREAEVADRGDGRRGFVDLLVTAPCRLGIELDRAGAREKSLRKLEQLDVEGRVILLREAPRGQVTQQGRVSIIGIAPAAPRLVTRPPGIRPHPLDEDRDHAASDVQHRAALWLERFADAHLAQRRSRFVPKPQRDFAPAVRLVRAYSDAELDALTALFLAATGDGFDDKPRTPGRLEFFATVLEERLKEVGQWPSAA